MVDALKVKSDGSFALKGTGSFSVKGGDPAYIIPGLEQSHWLVNSQTVTLNGSGKITAIADASSTENLVTEASVGATTYINPTYDATGWSSGGVTRATCDFNGDASLAANGWATRIGTQGATYTMAALIIGRYNSSMPLYSLYNNVNWGEPGCGYSMGLSASANGPNAPADNFNMSDFEQADLYTTNVLRYHGWWLNANSRTIPQLIVIEHNNNFGGSAWRVWQNGTLVSLYQGTRNGTISGNVTFNGFTLGAYRYTRGVNPSNAGWKGTMAEFHIWKGALTDSQRAAVTTDLMTRGGL